MKSIGLSSTLISLINVEPTLTDFEEFHPPQNKNSPSMFIDFMNIFQLPRLFQPPRLLERWEYSSVLEKIHIRILDQFYISLAFVVILEFRFFKN